MVIGFRVPFVLLFMVTTIFPYGCYCPLVTPFKKYNPMDTLPTKMYIQYIEKTTQWLPTGFRSGDDYYPWIPSLLNYIIFIAKIDYTQWHPLCSQNKNINDSIIQNGSGLKGNRNHNPRFIWTRSSLLWATPQ